MLHSLLFSRPTDALLSPEPWGGQGNLAIHTVAQDWLFFSFFVLFVMHFSARHFPLPRGAIGRVTFPFRVVFLPFFVSPSPATLAVRGKLLTVVSLIIALAFSFNCLSLRFSWLPSLAVQR